MKSGGDSETATPVPMPNTEVKRLSAESSWGISPCEDRTLPGFIFLKKLLTLHRMTFKIGKVDMT